MKDKIPRDHSGSIASEPGSDTNLVDQVFEDARATSNHDILRVDLTDELSAMRLEVDKITESVGLLAGRAKALVSETPVILEHELRDLIKRKPLTAVIGTVALSFGLTLRLMGSSNRRGR